MPKLRPILPHWRQGSYPAPHPPIRGTHSYVGDRIVGVEAYQADALGGTTITRTSLTAMRITMPERLVIINRRLLQLL